MNLTTDAIISECGLYRYRLDRIWGDGPAMGFIMLNPSTADAGTDDPTIRRCVSFAKREGCGQLIVVNLYAFRATNPADLWKRRPDLRHGPESSRQYDTAIADVTGPLVAAWGADAVKHDPDLVRDALWFHGDRLMCLGKTASGQPRHPLYVRGNTPLVALKGGAA